MNIQLFRMGCRTPNQKIADKKIVDPVEPFGKCRPSPQDDTTDKRRAISKHKTSGKYTAAIHKTISTSALTSSVFAALVIIPVGLCLSALVTPPAFAQWIVFDPTNYAQNVMTAARELQQVDNEIQGLTNQAQMLVNQSRNLASLPLSTLDQLQDSVEQTQNLISQAQGIAFNVQQVEQQFSSTYGANAVPVSASDSTLIANAQTRWQNSVGAFEDSLKIQAGVVGNIAADNNSMQALVSASQNATGALQAAQAGNQLLALQSQQLSDLVAVTAAKARADALAQANTATTEAESKVLYQHFSTLSPYTPDTVSMFNDSGT